MGDFTAALYSVRQEHEWLAVEWKGHNVMVSWMMLTKNETLCTITSFLKKTFIKLHGSSTNPKESIANTIWSCSRSTEGITCIWMRVFVMWVACRGGWLIAILTMGHWGKNLLLWKSGFFRSHGETVMKSWHVNERKMETSICAKR